MLRQTRFHTAQPETEVVRELHCAFDRARVTREQCRHLLAAAQMGCAGCREPAVEVVEASVGAHRGKRCGEPVLARCRVVDVAGRNDRQPCLRRQRRQRVVVGVVEGVAVVVQFHGNVVLAEVVDEECQLAGCRALALCGECRAYAPFSASGEDEPVAA